MKKFCPRLSFLFLLFISLFSQAQNTIRDRSKTFYVVLRPLDLSSDLQDYVSTSKNFPSAHFQTQFSKDYILNYLTYDPVKDPKRLAYDTGLIFGASLIEFAVLWNLPEKITNWNKEEIFNKERISEIGLTGVWKENIEAGPVWDQDGVFFNWICHPWVGGIYYMTARGSGYKRWESFSYSLFMSTFFWEFGVEAVAEIPSWQDMIITPVIGSVIGEQFFKLKKRIIRNERKVLNSKFLGFSSLLLMDPVNEILNVLGYKTQHKVKTYSSISPVEINLATGKPTWGFQVVMLF